MSATTSRYARPDVPTLQRLYIELGLGCPDIGWLYDRDAKTVLWWLRQAGIQTRPRGSNVAQQFKPGQPSAFKGRTHRPESIALVREASVARGAVPYLRDGQHWLVGARPEDNPNWKGGATPERQEFYRSPDWKAAANTVWRRDNACCQRCMKDWRTVDRATEPLFHVHHIVSFQVRELRTVLTNLVLLCRPCHLWVHSNANTDRAWLAAEREFATPSLFDLADLKEAA